MVFRSVNPKVVECALPWTRTSVKSALVQSGAKWCLKISGNYQIRFYLEPLVLFGLTIFAWTSSHIFLHDVHAIWGRGGGGGVEIGASIDESWCMFSPSLDNFNDAGAKRFRFGRILVAVIKAQFVAVALSCILRRCTLSVLSPEVLSL